MGVYYFSLISLIHLISHPAGSRKASTSPQSPVPNPQSPVPSPQSPIPNP
ncbi:hypothetical protein FDUTEX481_04873 [Tolypothrix sp. PCC 7601]|nr:hypothetical protein FDUTEX481_04873 [Tolypothrix sp. PCC 7601]